MYPVVPPQFDVVSRRRPQQVRILANAITGEPGAAYWAKPFGALLRNVFANPYALPLTNRQFSEVDPDRYFFPSSQ